MIIGFCKASHCLKLYGYYFKPVKTEVTLKKEGYFSLSRSLVVMLKWMNTFPRFVYKASSLRARGHVAYRDFNLKS